MVKNTRDSRPLIFALALLAVGWSGCTVPAATQKDSQLKIDSAPQTPGSPQSFGRYQLVASGNTGGPFLIDTSTGCVWHMVQNEKTRRPTFIEADVENLHWGWGSGAQQLLAAQIESLSHPEEQKRILKQNLQKTECGQFNVTLSSEGTRRPEQTPDAKPKGSEK
jgi:hypothetical protein